MAPLVDLKMPALGQTVAEGTVTAWLKKPGEAFAADESLVSIETDKAQTEIPAPFAGTLTEILVAEGSLVPVGTVLARLSEGGAAAAKPSAPTAAMAPAKPTPSPASAILSAVPRTVAGGTAIGFLSPAVRRLAREHGLTASQVLALPGSGRRGRVTLADLAARLAAGTIPADVAAAAGGDDVEIVPMTGMRLRIAEHMLAAKRSAPHVNTVAEADMSAVAAARARHGEAFAARHGFSLSYNAFLMKASARALVAFPSVNAILDDRGIVMHRRVHLGMAVALEPSGLVVPVVRDAHLKSVRELAVEAQRLGELARARKLNADDMSGGTCTVTNPGVFGNLFGTPIIHLPQAAIVDFGAIKRRVVVLPGDAIAIRPMAYVVVAWDHRVMDGATAARFLQRLVKELEQFPQESID